MSNVKGRIAVDVQFTDSTTSEGVQSLKTITLQDATEYATGKVAIVTGTTGTAAVTINVAPSTYRDASGALVSLASVERIAFAATPSASISTGQRADSFSNVITSRNGQINIVDVPSVQLVYTTAGTASFTLVIYGT